jgi:TM2 domain-containing membrane protein YozV
MKKNDLWIRIIKAIVFVIVSLVLWGIISLIFMWRGSSVQNSPDYDRIATTATAASK